MAEVALKVRKQELHGFDQKNFILHQHFIRKDYNACKALIKVVFVKNSIHLDLIFVTSEKQTSEETAIGISELFQCSAFKTETWLSTGNV